MNELNNATCTIPLQEWERLRFIENDHKSLKEQLAKENTTIILTRDDRWFGDLHIVRPPHALLELESMMKASQEKAKKLEAELEELKRIKWYHFHRWMFPKKQKSFL